MQQQYHNSNTRDRGGLLGSLGLNQGASSACMCSFDAGGGSSSQVNASSSCAKTSAEIMFVSSYHTFMECSRGCGLD